LGKDWGMRGIIAVVPFGLRLAQAEEMALYIPHNEIIARHLKSCARCARLPSHTPMEGCA
jgi:hypothetical protein